MYKELFLPHRPSAFDQMFWKVRPRFTPHMCGEYSPALIKSITAARFTPTCVGSTWVFLYIRWPNLGSPPHVWGVRPRFDLSIYYPRFTPTCVGSTRPASSRMAFISVHPHMCGEYHSDGEIPLSRIRFTPTCVGSTFSAEELRLPAVRFTPTCVGSTVWGAAFQEPLVGSPPHVWGVLEKQRRGSHRLRFTPTCVGSTRSAPFRPTRRAVHPHMCGEYSSMSHRFAAYAGSPPHVWGVHFAKRLRYRSHRGSPPHVWGVRLPSKPSGTPTAVHPHMCGEYFCS